jgi:hypothetical protein
MFAAAAKLELRQRSELLQSKATWIVALFSFLVFAPIATYLVAYNMDWSLGYVVNPSRLPVVLLPGLGLLFVAVPLFGFASGCFSAQRHSSLPLVVQGSISLACALLSVLVGLPRFVTDGTYVEYHDQFGVRALAGSPLGYSLLWSFLALSLAVLWTYGTLRQMAHRGTPRPPL